MSKSHKDKKLSPEHKKNISKSLIGNTRNLGLTRSDEYKNKLSKIKKGTTNAGSFKLGQIPSHKKKFTSEQLLAIRSDIRVIKYICQEYNIGRATYYRIKNKKDGWE